MIVASGSPYLVIVPARGGSKELSRKNLRLLAGRPLLAWTIAHVRASRRPLRLAVSTDDAEIAALARAEGATVIVRPPELATDDSPSEAALLHALEHLPGAGEARHVVLLQATSPVREPGSLDEAIELYESSSADSLVSVSPLNPLQWAGEPLSPLPLYDIAARPRRQCVGPELVRYGENGSIVVSGVAGLVATGNRLHGKVVMYVMRPHEGIDVDTAYELRLAQAFMEEHDAAEPHAPCERSGHAGRT